MWRESSQVSGESRDECGSDTGLSEPVSRVWHHQWRHEYLRWFRVLAAVFVFSIIEHISIYSGISAGILKQADLPNHHANTALDVVVLIPVFIRVAAKQSGDPHLRLPRVSKWRPMTWGGCAPKMPPSFEAEAYCNASRNHSNAEQHRHTKK